MVVHSTGLMDPEKPMAINPEDYSRYFEDLSFLKKLEKDPDLQYTSLNTVLSYHNGKYMVEPYATGCIGAHEGYTLKFVSSSIKDDTLTLTYAYYWSEYNYEDEYEIMYKEENGKVVYDKIIADEYGEHKVSNGKDIDYDVFTQYNFIFDLSNDNLRLQKIEYKEAK